MLCVAPPPKITKDFIVIHNHLEYPVSKLRFLMQSAKFRDISRDLKNQIEISDGISNIVFEEFIKAINGEEYIISTENVFGLIKLAKDWSIEGLEDQLNEFITETPEISSILGHINSKNSQNISNMIDIMASNIDELVTLSSFCALPLEIIHQVFTNPNLAIINHHNTYTFIMKMINNYGEKASFLSKYLELPELQRDDIVELLESPSIDKTAILPQIVNVAKLYVKETERLERRIDELADVVSSLPKQNQYYQEITAKIQEMGSIINELELQLVNVTDRSSQEVTALSKKIADFDKKVRSELRKSSADIGSLSNYVKTLEVAVENAKKSTTRKPQPVVNNEVESKKADTASFSPSPDKPLSGIIDYLSQGLNGKSLDSVISITASSTDHCLPTQVAERGWNEYWFSQNKQGQWISFDFLQKKVKLSDYTIKTIKFSEDSCHMVSWVVEVSNDSARWIEVDNQKTTSLNGSNKVVTFKCKAESEPSRYIRIRQTDTNARGDNLMALNNVEFFGTLI